MKVLACWAALALAPFAVPAAAGTPGEALTVCMEQSATAADKRVLARWVFGAVALAPDVAALSKVDDKRRTEFSAGVARIYERLLTESCRAQAEQAVRQEGPESIAASLRTMSQLGARELFGQPQVAGNLQALAEQIDRNKLALVFPKSPSQAGPSRGR